MIRWVKWCIKGECVIFKWVILYQEILDRSVEREYIIILSMSL